MAKWLLAVGMFQPFFSAQATQDPEALYNRTCAACHAGQLPQAPRKGDAAAWEPRLARGLDVLVAHVTQGFKAMPPRGLCMDCSAEDYRLVILWMSGSPDT
ncbi:MULTISPECIES: c-type cytochrome [unclassified Pseudomonas]|uniref:c-type cytochrome n=1 Tax=Pseudomonas TaxID=286 RepID=UPI0016443082|nr:MULTISPECIES: c-type cytochrome [unclassified Pseudomonas]MBC3422062.1 cytochrome c5 family protein [Pseudomonas sp. RW3S2]MBC3465933.1 cytochrome c5 family protein [Pseudomonas sp. RW10S2]QXI43299.1 c-type cytochrome [Pseudomonas wayambapalatensis]